VVEAHVVLAGGLDERERADDVRVEERARVVQGVVVVALRRVVHNDVAVFDEAVDKGRVGDVALDEGEPLGVESVERGHVARVGEIVEDGHVVIGGLEHVMHEVRTDETGSTGNEKLAHRIS
jgi:hypothetical protein